MTGERRGRVRLEPGAIIEIPTPKGLAYAQYTLSDQLRGALLRVLPGLFEERPPSLAELAATRERFWTFFPLRAAISRGLVRLVGAEEIPERARGMPLMRARGGIDRSGTVLNWWLWDGQREWNIGKALTPEQTELSIASTVNNTMLVERIVNDWLPSDCV